VSCSIGANHGICLLDTGSPYSDFGSRLLYGIGKSSAKDSDRLICDTLALGDSPKVTLESRSLRIEDASEQQFLDSCHIDGIVGLDLLSSLSIRWSRRGQQFEVLTPKCRTLAELVHSLGSGGDTGAVEVVPVSIADGRCVCTARVNGITGVFYIDTGGRGCLLQPWIVKSALLMPGQPVKIETPRGISGSQSLDDASVNLGTGLTYAAHANTLSSAVLGPVNNIDKDDFGGILGNDISLSADLTTLDLRDQVFLAALPPQPKLDQEASPTRLTGLPTCPGPFIVSLQERKGYLRVLRCETLSVFEVPASSTLPKFTSLSGLISNWISRPAIEQNVTLFPGQRPPKGWLTFTFGGAPTLACPPIGHLYLPKTAHLIFGKGWGRTRTSSGGSSYYPNGMSAAEHSATFAPTASPPGCAAFQFEATVPVSIPDNWAFVYPETWRLTLRKGTVVLSPAGSVGTSEASPPPMRGVSEGYHWRYEPEIASWAEIPNGMWLRS
jgi:hypothetical protein